MFPSSRGLWKDILTQDTCSRRVQERPAQPDGQEGPALRSERGMSSRDDGEGLEPGPLERLVRSMEGLYIYLYS